MVTTWIISRSSNLGRTSFGAVRPALRLPRATGTIPPDADRSDHALTAADHRGDRRGRGAARIPPAPPRQGRRVHGRGGRRAPTLHAVPARWLSDPADRVREGCVGSAVVTGRSPPRVRARRRGLGPRGGRVASHAGRGQARRRASAAVVSRRPPARVPVTAARLDAGVGDRRARPASRTPPDGAEAAATGGRYGDRA